MAVFLGIGGLVLGMFFAPKSGAVQETVAFGEASIIPRAQGAEIDRAALTVESAPLLASVNTGAELRVAANDDVLYGEGALKDPEQPVKSSASPSVATNKKVLIYGIIYQVVAGDTLDSISSEFNVPKTKIEQFNPSVNFSALDPGISIIVPGEKDVNVFSG